LVIAASHGLPTGPHPVPDDAFTNPAPPRLIPVFWNQSNITLRSAGIAIAGHGPRIKRIAELCASMKR
jgi:hypothetical protein